MAGGISVKFGATDAGFTSTVSKVNSSMKKMDDNTRSVSGSVKASFATMAKAGAALAVGFGAIKVAMNAVRGTLDNFKEALDMGGELNDLSARTGETAGNLMILRRAFDNAGAGADKVGPAINKLQKFLTEAAIGTKTNVETLDALGMSFDELQGKTPTEQMQILAEKINGIQDPTLRAGIAMKIFGRSGGELLPLLSSFSDEIETAKDQLGGLPSVMDRASKTFDNISDNLTVIKGKVTEAAAGFLEKLAPALNYFTTQLAGSDAAGWGSRMMDSILRVADTLVGAFVAPQEAIKAIGSMLSFAISESGNQLLNGFITATRFLSEFFKSDIISAASSGIGPAFQKAFSDSLKLLVDGLADVVRFFQKDMLAAGGLMFKFYLDGFSQMLKFVASDLFNALTSPLDFITGKLGSALGNASKSGGITFKSAYDEGITTTLDRLSDGLGKSSEKYGQQMSDATKGIKDEFSKITDNVKVSDKDFFGSEKAKANIAESMGKIEDAGKTLREATETKFKPIEEAKKDSAVIADNFNLAAMGAENAAESVKESLSYADEVWKRIKQSQADDKIDPGGRLKARADEALAKGQFGTAERAGNRLDRREQEQRIQDAFGLQGTGKTKRSLQDIAKEQGVDTKGKTSKQLRGELDAIAKSQGELKPGAQGKTRAEAERAGVGKAFDPMKSISDAVDAIKKLVEKIEPKLPTAALGA